MFVRVNLGVGGIIVAEGAGSSFDSDVCVKLSKVNVGCVATCLQLLK